MADFKKLANVETIEEVTEEDTVLVVQGGEVKQAPKTQVGVAIKPDIVLNINNDMSATAETEVENVYEYLKACCENGVMPNMIVYLNIVNGDITFMIMSKPFAIFFQTGNSIEIKADMGEGTVVIMCAEDNTFTVQV